ncbi:MAG: GDP-mannose 4,6-dehydratase [Akkermansiaceae bacterium]|nr:GDP-mannose 4,6-dehydratase [Akkermansiaceae bacterium]
MRSLSSLLLTGGAGFIGSTLVRKILERSEVEKLIVLDKFTYAGDRNHLVGPDHDSRLTIVKGDILDQSLTTRLIEEHQFTGVLNLAAESHVDRSIASTQEFALTNVLGASSLLEICRLLKVPFLQCSTDEVYGSTPFPKKFDEFTKLRPSSPYSASKASADLLTIAAHTTYLQDVVIARCTNNYGPRQHREKLIPTLIYHAMRDEPLPIYGSGQQIRDWIHVEDCALGLIAAFEHGTPGKIYHLGARDEHTNLGIARTILKQLGKPESLICHVDDRPGHDARYALATRHSLESLDWKARIPFRTGFEETVREISSQLRVV